jgi:Tol biopolymer transport system component/DNA-binding winged helix-turn-helix (wHTH) protein
VLYWLRLETARVMKEAVGTPQSSPTPPIPGLIRFGNFEVDTHASELRRGGIKIKLSGQPFDVLVALLEKPGQVVTREELHDKLWSQGTFVDFEHGLNKAVNKVREALGDDADNPRFIETLPRRGYRFLAPVVTQVSMEAPVENPPADNKQNALTHSQAGAEKSRRRVWLWTSGAIATAIAAAIIASQPPRSPRVLRYTQLTNDGLQKNRLATDGSRIYFDEQSAHEHEFLAEVSVKGGVVTRLAPLAMDSGPNMDLSPVLDYSPTRSELLIRTGIAMSPLSAISVTGGTAPRRLGDIIAEDAAWSPDGQSIAFSRANEIDIAKADGSDSRKLAMLQGDPMYLRWSPDGKVLRFTFWPERTFLAGSSSIWEIARDGSNLRAVFPDWRVRNDYGGTWTADGKYFLFRSIRNGRGSIFAIRENRDLLERTVPQPVELTTGPMSFATPVPSPDGKQIFTEGFLDRGELMRYDSRRRTWEHYLSGISAVDLDFSRDGEWVTYVLVPEGTLWRSRVDGSERLQLTISPLRTALPRWSPDGKTIAFMGLEPGELWTIFMVPADGGKTEQLLSDKELYANPDWSSDGSQLVFGESDYFPKAIHILDLKSRRVSDMPGSAGLFSPRWSPDGRSIIALTANMVPSPPPAKLMIFDPGNRNWQEWCEAPYISYPEFSRRGNYVYFSDSTTGFFRVRRGSNKVERVATLDSPGAIKMDPFWYWTGLTPDDSPLFLHDTNTREIYALDVDLP